jgi:hypothetical protein
MLLSPARPIVSAMSRHSTSDIDRPAPDHYQRRLSAAFNRLPAQMLPPRLPARPPAERHPVTRRLARHGLRQLALPLEAG